MRKAIQDAGPLLQTTKDAAWPAFQTSQIAPDKLRPIQTFLDRPDSCEPALCRSMAGKISKRMAEKVRTSVFGCRENFLEAVYEQYRSKGRFRS